MDTDCPFCHGYGSADGLPCGTPERDFGPDAPDACPACEGTGEAGEVVPLADELAEQIRLTA